MGTVALRRIPEDDAIRAALENARRAAEITGPQWGIFTCWRCLADLDPQATETWKPVDGELRLECRDHEACTTRWAEASPDLVLDGPWDGDGAA